MSIDLKKRVFKVAAKLPKRYTHLVIEKNPELAGQEDRIRKVVSLQVADQAITEALENLVRERK